MVKSFKMHNHMPVNHWTKRFLCDKRYLCNYVSNVVDAFKQVDFSTFLSKVHVIVAWRPFPLKNYPENDRKNTSMTWMLLHSMQ